MSRIDSFHIVRRISLSITFGLGLLQDVLEISPLVRHLRENVVGCPVQNAEDRLNPVCHQSFLNGPDDRNASAHRPFKINIHAVPLGGPKDLVSVKGKKGFVGCDDMFSDSEWPSG